MCNAGVRIWFHLKWFIKHLFYCYVISVFVWFVLEREERERVEQEQREEEEREYQERLRKLEEQERKQRARQQEIEERERRKEEEMRRPPEEKSTKVNRQVYTQLGDYRCGLVFRELDLWSGQLLDSQFTGHDLTLNCYRATDRFRRSCSQVYAYLSWQWNIGQIPVFKSPRGIKSFLVYNYLFLIRETLYISK